MISCTTDPDAVTLLDGGLATSLEADGYDLPGPLWSARALLDAPERVVAAHAGFARAGAEVLFTASYQLSAESLALIGEPPGRLDELLALSVQLARSAARRSTRVAGSLGPFGATLGDGSEYTGRYDQPPSALRDFHAPRVEGLLATDADVVVFETIPGGEEVEAVAELVSGSGRATWVSVTVAGDGTRTPRGEPLREALAPAAAVDEVVGVGVNCCPPPLVVPALEALEGIGVALLAKPNAGDQWDPARHSWRRPATPVDPGSWVRAGARLVGGCCGTSANDLAALDAALRG